jgi:hypothetical protein
MTSADTKNVPGGKTLDELRDENRKLRELVADLSSIVARSVLDEKTK